jgi:AcrR family transcriptional regulator
MPIDDATRGRIIEVAREHFFRLGFSKVTMSEIATELGMSKKTLYEYFPSKEELLSEVITSVQNNVSEKIDAIIADESLDFVEKLKLLFSHGAEFHSRFTKHFFIDIQKNAPQIWKCCDSFRMERMRKNVEKLVREGVKKGYFRKDVNEHVVVMMHTLSVQNLMTPEVLAELPVTMNQLFETIVKVIFEGILTDKARVLQMEKVLSSQNNKEHGL